MNIVISTILLAIVGIVFYIKSCKWLSLYFMNSGMNENQIIAYHQQHQIALSPYAVKYPEAEIKTKQYVIFIFGFLFALSSFLVVFSVKAKSSKITDKHNKAIDIDETVQIIDEINFEKTVTESTPKIIHQTQITPVIEIEYKENSIINETAPTQIAEPAVATNNQTVINTPIETPPKTNSPSFSVEKMPRFKGCEHLSEEEADECTRLKIKKYMSNITYPRDFINEEIEGKVWITFVVNENGEIEDVSIARSEVKELNNHIKKYVAKMPKFASAGMQSGKKLSVKYASEIVFKID